jgi:hypothetical protein
MSTHATAIPKMESAAIDTAAAARLHASHRIASQRAEQNK